MVLLFKEKNEIKAVSKGMKAYYDAYGIDYDEDEFNDEVHQEVDLHGLVGLKKVDNETIKLSFNDGDTVDVNVDPAKMSSVLYKIKNNRKAKIRVKCY